MTRNGAIALLVGALAFYAFFHFVFGVEAFTLFQIFFIKTFAFIKSFIARLTWEMVYIFTANFFKRAAIKVLFIQAPMAIAVPILTVLALRPQTKRRLKKRLSIVKYRLKRWYRQVIAWYERWFGGSALVVFIASCFFAALTFVFFMFTFGFEFFIWLGSWSWVSGFFRTIGSFFSPLFNTAGGIVRGALMRFPMVGAFFALIGNVWRERIARKLPSLEKKRKQVLKDSLRRARNTREHSFGVYLRWERRRERRKERQREARRKKKEQKEQKRRDQAECTYLRFMWVGGTVPRWDRIGFRVDEYYRMVDRAINEHDRLYVDSVLGARVAPTYLEGGDVAWRTFRR